MDSPILLPKAFTGQEDYLRPEEGPLAEYVGFFPHRTVEWDRHRQLFSIWHTNPFNGARDRIELVHNTLEEREGSNTIVILNAKGEPITTCNDLIEVDQITGAERFRGLSPIKGMRPGRRLFRPLDYVFVRTRIRAAYLEAELGLERFLAEEVDAFNAGVSDSQINDFARETAAAAFEARRWRRHARGGDRPAIGVGAQFTP